MIKKQRTSNKRSLLLFNTMKRRVVNFAPIDENLVLMYSCGPTVYTSAHIGNLRSFLMADLVKKVLNLTGYRVKHIMNITDVGHLTSDADTGEDKVEKASRKKHKSAWEITQHYTKEFKQDLRRLNIRFPNKFTKATDYIDEMINLVQKLIDKGVTYRTSDGIYFDSTKFSKYGKLARLDIKGLQSGKRVDVKEKKHPTDFALWKFAPKNQKRQMEWKAFGHMGFPGWHIECSTMAMTELGKTIDIHTGGVDHISVHHTNEIAQVEAVTSQPFCHYWIHGEILVPEKGKKMSKSAGSFITLSELVKRGYSPLAYRYLLLQSHYRKRLKFTWKALDAAQEGYEHFKHLVSELDLQKFGKSFVINEYRQNIESALLNDINTPQALALLWEIIKSPKIGGEDKRKLIRFCDRVFSLDLLILPKNNFNIPQRIIELAEKRNLARNKKEWAKSDALRKQIGREGYLIKDGNDGLYTVLPK